MLKRIKESKNNNLEIYRLNVVSNRYFSRLEAVVSQSVLLVTEAENLVSRSAEYRLDTKALSSQKIL